MLQKRLKVGRVKGETRSETNVLFFFVFYPVEVWTIRLFLAGKCRPGAAAVRLLLGGKNQVLQEEKKKKKLLLRREPRHRNNEKKDVLPVWIRITVFRPFGGAEVHFAGGSRKTRRSRSPFVMSTPKNQHKTGL